MAKRKGLTYEQKLINALKKLPNPLFDVKHNLKIYFNDNRARSNQSRFEHITNPRHSLLASDIERIVRYINVSKLKMDHERKETYNLFIKRNSFNNEYIKLCLEIKDDNPREATVKTIFITRVVKW